MPNFRVNVAIQQKGQVFDAAKSKAAAARMVIGINDTIAQEGVNRVKNYCQRLFKNPTGYYESQITVDRRKVYRGVTDNGVRYGSWLEGTSSRNASTRFKGYRIFRTVKQELDQDKIKIAQPIVTAFVNEMNR